VTRPRHSSKENELDDLRRQLDHSKAALDATVAGEIDSVISPLGPILLREAQAALRRSEASFRALIENLPDQVWVHRDGVIVYANADAIRALGFGHISELRGRNLLDFVAADDRASVAQRWRVTPPVSPGAERTQIRMQHRDGSSITVELTMQTVVFDGQSATLEVAHDITSQKKLEAHLLITDRMASIGLLAAGVAHEINNPLSFVLANLTFVALKLAEAPPANAQEEVLAAIEEAKQGAERVARIVKDIKTFSRSEDTVRADVDLHRLLDSMTRIAANEICQRARLIKAYSPEPLFAFGDESRLGQVFLNLIINAAQAIVKGAAEQNQIRITTRRQPDGQSVIEVRDTGPGMTSAVMSRLFTPFFTTKPMGVGTGLGLSICRQIVISHGGHIDVETEVGTGSCFSVWLPAPPDEKVAPAPLSIERPVHKTRRGRVLVIDDEQLLRSTLQRIISSRHDVVLAANGKAGIACLATQGPFDVIFCDVMMPSMSGLEVYEAIAADSRKNAERVVFMTGGVFTEAAQGFIAATSNVKIDKPFEPAAILELVSQFVDEGEK